MAQVIKTKKQKKMAQLNFGGTEENVVIQNKKSL